MKRKMSPSDPSEGNDLEFEMNPTKKINLADARYIEPQLSKQFKDDKITEEKPLEKTENFKGFSTFNIVNIDKQDPSHYKEFKRLKYKNVIYNLNDILMIRNCEDANNDFIGILRKIIKVMIDNNINILIEVQW